MTQSLLFPCLRGTAPFPEGVLVRRGQDSGLQGGFHHGIVGGYGFKRNPGSGKGLLGNREPVGEKGRHSQDTGSGGAKSPYGREAALPASPKSLPLTEEKRFAVPFSYVDLNGHMNNTKYCDLADDLLTFEKEGQLLKMLSAEYLHEIREGQDVRLRWGFGEGTPSAFLTGEDEAGTALFRLRLEYAPHQ